MGTVGLSPLSKGLWLTRFGLAWASACKYSYSFSFLFFANCHLYIIILTITKFQASLPNSAHTEPSASIAGETDQYVRGGSTVTLRCVISNAIEEPSFIFWYQVSMYTYIDAYTHTYLYTHTQSHAPRQTHLQILIFTHKLTETYNYVSEI